MKYRATCIFVPEKPCPLYELDLEVDGLLCQTCVDFNTLVAMKAQTISQLLMAFHSEEKAREMFEKIKELIVMW